ncbi:MAG: ferrochelatase [Candidatus Hydrogenedentes bacterium]|nr:ferrochelatase [Candidatus Hydrogenedentota bacterium]
METDNREAGSGGRMGLLLLQTGSPDTCDLAGVRRYLRRFLMDPHVISLPFPLRALLVHGIIAPLRARKSLELYRHIWTGQGAPLTAHTRNLAAAIAARRPDLCVRHAAVYASPTPGDALRDFVQEGVGEVLVLPLFPQHATASRGAALAAVRAAAARAPHAPALRELPPFYDAPWFIEPLARLYGPLLRDFAPDRVIFSFHGLPLAQAARDAAAGPECDYVGQCKATMDALVGVLGLDTDRCRLGWQSRFGRGWLAPDTESLLAAAPAGGAARVALCAPCFVADCLETLEELGLRGRACFMAAGGRELLLLPCLNVSDDWVEAVCRRALPPPKAKN